MRNKYGALSFQSYDCYHALQSCITSFHKCSAVLWMLRHFQIYLTSICPYKHCMHAACMLSCFCRTWLSVTLWTVACLSSVHGISQARILEWVAMAFSRGSSWPRDQTCISCIAIGFLTTEPPGKPVTKTLISQKEICVGCEDDLSAFAVTTLDLDRFQLFEWTQTPFLFITHV